MDDPTHSDETRFYRLRGRSKFVEIIVLVRGVARLQPGYANHEGREEASDAEDDSVAGSFGEDGDARHDGRYSWCRRRRAADSIIFILDEVGEYRFLITGSLILLAHGRGRDGGRLLLSLFVDSHSAPDLEVSSLSVGSPAAIFDRLLAQMIS